MPSDLSEQLEQSSQRDGMTVTPDGQSCTPMVEGVRMRDLVLHTDDRGTVCEMFDPRWNWHPDPLVFTYFYTVRPGLIKGWAMHKTHEDRYCLLQGEMKVVLYDTRSDSPTFGKIREVYLSERRRQLLSIPTGVWHADQNIGTQDCLIVNFPTIPYDHANPDKYRLPLDTELIPYKFDQLQGY
ncbi:dTDP-4-dehydrorhamnose 3,5-epimerase family protein [soil metagenome]